MKLRLMSAPPLEGATVGWLQSVVVADSKEDAMAEQVKASAIDIEMNKEGEAYTAVLPVSIPYSQNDATKVLASMSRVTFDAESSRSGNGTRRLMLRATMPYYSLDPDALNNNAYAISPSRSAKSITAHFVLTIPREAEQDLRGLFTGSAGTAFAMSQIAGIIELLRMLLGQNGAEFLSAELPLAFNYQADPDDPSTVDAATSYSSVAPVRGSDTITGFAGVPGLVFPTVGSTMTKPSNPLQRAIMGLSPLADDAVASRGPASSKALARVDILGD